MTLAAYKLTAKQKDLFKEIITFIPDALYSRRCSHHEATGLRLIAECQFQLEEDAKVPGKVK